MRQSLLSQQQVNSKGCSRGFILCVLYRALDHVRKVHEAGQPVYFPFCPEIVKGWLLAAENDCNICEPYYQYGLGGTLYDPQDITTYWTLPQQFCTWWKNNVERKNKFEILQRDACYCTSYGAKNDEKTIARANYCQNAIAISLNVKNYFYRHLPKRGEISIVQYVIPYPMPHHMTFSIHAGFKIMDFDAFNSAMGFFFREEVNNSNSSNRDHQEAVPYHDTGHYQSNTLAPAAPSIFPPNMHSTIETKKRKKNQTLASVPRPSSPRPSSIQVNSPQVSTLQPVTFENMDFNKSVHGQVEPAQIFTLQKPGTFENVLDFNSGSYADDATHYSVPHQADRPQFDSLTAPNSNLEKSILPPYSSENVQQTKGDSEATPPSSHSSLPMTSSQHFSNVLHSKEYIQQANSHKNNPFRSYQSEDSDGETASEYSHRFRSGSSPPPNYPSVEDNFDDDLMALLTQGIDDKKEAKLFEEFEGGLASLSITPLLTESNSAVESPFGSRCPSPPSPFTTFCLQEGTMNSRQISPRDNSNCFSRSVSRDSKAVRFSTRDDTRDEFTLKPLRNSPLDRLDEIAIIPNPEIQKLVSKVSNIANPLPPFIPRERRGTVPNGRRSLFPRTLSSSMDIDGSSTSTPTLRSLFSSVDTLDYVDLVATLHENEDDIPLTTPLPTHHQSS